MVFIRTYAYLAININMAYNSESIYLDLKKNLHNMNYTSLTTNQQASQQGLYSQTHTDVQTEDLASTTYLFFEERDIVLKDIRNICLYMKDINNTNNVVNFPYIDVVTRVNVILHKYMEKPSLLDNLIEHMVDELIDAFRHYIVDYLSYYQQNNSCQKIHIELEQMVSILVTLDKVRGTHNIVKYLGHNANDFEPLLFFIISSEGIASWDLKYFSLLWLSVVLLVPFDFKRLDSNVIIQYYTKTYQSIEFERIELLALDFCQRSLKSAARIGVAISRCVSSIFRRPDMNSIIYFDHFFFWGLDELAQYGDTNMDAFYCSNIYRTLCSIVKNCYREFIEDNYEAIIGRLVEIHEKNVSIKEPVTMQHGKLKLVLSIVDKLLRPIDKRWTYTAPKKQLADNIEASMTVPMLTNIILTENQQNTSNSKEAEGEYSETVNYEYITAVEKAIDFAFEGLQNSDSNIRYLAAKGLATIAKKLPESLSDELLDAMLSMYEDGDESANHGICLAIGEFCRARILSPRFLPRIVDLLKACLLFEAFEGSHATGSIVRDAACYICWSFARFYDKNEMEPFVDTLASTLLLLALFDKEGNCRRAAAASFQENVGRQGYFPNGIQIISEMDYFTVGNVMNAYLNIAPFVASFNSYTTVIIDHLAFNRLEHAEKPIRIIAAKALGLAAINSPKYVIEEILPKLIEGAKKKNLTKRHGCILGISAVLLSLSGQSIYMLQSDMVKENIFMRSLKINDQKLIKTGEYMKAFKAIYEERRYINNIHLINAKLLKEVIGLPAYIIAAGLLKGKGGEVTRIALSGLISALSKSQVELTIHDIKAYLEFIHEAFRTTIIEIHEHANDALAVFSEQYLKEKPQDFLYIIDEFIKRIGNEVIKDIKKSFCQGIASFSGELLNLRKEEVIDTLAANAIVDKKIAMNDPEIRKHCVASLTGVFIKLGPLRTDSQLFGKVLARLSKTINDYTVDKRGDIGLIIREQTIDNYLDLLIAIIDWFSIDDLNIYITEDQLCTIFSGILTQIVDPNDRLRLKAGFIMQVAVNKLFHRLPYFTHKEILTQLFDNSLLKSKFQEHQDKYFQNYDVSLVDDKKFLAYTLNDEFVYYWNIPACTFSHLIKILECEKLAFDFLKGFIFSISSPQENISQCAYDAIKGLIDSNNDISSTLLTLLINIIKRYKLKEKFYVASLKTLSLLMKIDSFCIEEQPDVINELLSLIKQHTEKSKSINKLTTSANVICQLLLLKNDIDRCVYLESVKGLVESFLFSEFPIVRKAFVDPFYMFLITKGDAVFGDDELSELSEYLTNMDINAEDEGIYEIFKQRWTSIHATMI